MNKENMYVPPVLSRVNSCDTKAMGVLPPPPQSARNQSTKAMLAVNQKY